VIKCYWCDQPARRRDTFYWVACAAHDSDAAALAWAAGQMPRQGYGGAACVVDLRRLRVAPVSMDDWKEFT
jgi:hypothetical protein